MDMVQLPPESQETCREEVKLLARLQHRNVVKYYDSFEGMRCNFYTFTDFILLFIYYLLIQSVVSLF